MYLKQLSKLSILTLVLMLAFTGITFAADKYPSKPITIIVTFGAGGLSEIITRNSAERLGKELGVPIKVVCKPGGGTIPGVMAFLNKPADGYTMIRWSPPSVVTNPLIRKVPFKPLEDFIPLFLDATTSNVLYVKEDSPYKTIDDFIEAAKKKKMLISINQVGAPPHLSAVQFGEQMGVKFKLMTYKTIPKGVLAVMGGHVDATIGQLLQQQQYEGKIRALVILDKRMDHQAQWLPNVPTVAEAFPGKTSGSWINSGLAVKKGTPKHIVDRLVQAAEKVLNTDDYKEALEVKAKVVFRWVSGPEKTLALIKEGIDLYKPIIDKLGIKK